jgi:hypothetical protein
MMRPQGLAQLVGKYLETFDRHFAVVLRGRVIGIIEPDVLLVHEDGAAHEILLRLSDLVSDATSEASKCRFYAEHPDPTDDLDKPIPF